MMSESELLEALARTIDPEAWSDRAMRVATGKATAAFAAIRAAGWCVEPGWQPIATAPQDGSWVCLRGGQIDYGWDCNEQPPFVVGQWVRCDKGHWQFAWYDGGYYGEYETPTEWRPASPLPDAALWERRP